ncbi:hypothetical protein P171DRAFT_480080 [Karstenula rhodostoma CBS 690.94]|uniref:Uncharacterized protein n=1 Tax=Karstenula rhodostoma CBS 690.94 TaxID=1392251 RepID=A0A9P4PVH2_9PLEO|nr:hypothetical protein P171DRAFT_480080 [Karstenula rhodostoma CBS 690.94]
MKLTIFLTLLTLAGLGLAAPTVHETDRDIAISKLLSRSSATDCDECNEHRNNCLRYGVGDKGSGEWRVCDSYVCRKYDCRSCGDEFNCDNANLTMPPGW